ncbi:MAG TPA: hypothetical protein VGG45_06790 [Terracidiphilus sp.]|jgi:hypothetical protein
MATVPQTAAVRPDFHLAGRGGLVDKYFYFAMSLLLAGIVAYGFGQTVNHNLFHATPPRPLLLWFHGAVFSAWVVFFIFQSTLVRTRNVKWHRFFGWFGAGLGTAMIFLGVTVAIVMARFDTNTLHEPGGDAFLVVPLFDMAAFAMFFSLAVLWRKKPEMHRRLMYIATCGLVVAALGRIPFTAQHNFFYYSVDVLIFLGVLRDLVVSRRIHRVYLVALPVLIAAHTFVIHTLDTAPAWWIRIADRILA